VGFVYVDRIFLSLLQDRCNIYHLEEHMVSKRPPLPPEPVFSYGDTPDLADVKCKFCLGGSRTDTRQGEPINRYEALIQLDLPQGTDVRVNDKVVDRRTGYAYTAETPRLTHDGHHIVVMVKRTETQEPL
jgi:hypothetical protein